MPAFLNVRLQVSRSSNVHIQEPEEGVHVHVVLPVTMGIWDKGVEHGIRLEDAPWEPIG